MNQLKPILYLVLFTGLIGLSGCGRETIIQEPTAPKQGGESLQMAVGNCVEAPSGMVSWWTADGDALDIVSGNDGTLQNGITYAAGMVDRAFSFDGVDDYVEVPDHSNLQLPNAAFSLDMWFITPSIALDQTLLSKGMSDSNEEYTISLYPPGFGSIYWDYGGTQAYVRTVPGVVVSNQWYHLAVVYDPSVFPPGKVYLNGVEQSIAQYGYDQSHIVSSGSNLYIGAQNAGSPYYSGSFDGLIDEVEIFNRALTANEIAAIYQAGSAGKCKEVTVCHMPGTPAEKTLRIPIQALDAHLGHGDAVGPCQ